MQPLTNRLVIRRRGAVEHLEERLPPLMDGEVLLKTHLSLLSSGTERAIFDESETCGRAWEQVRTLPRSLGYCNVATVIGAGPAVDDRIIGQRVSSHAPHASFVNWPAAELRMVPPEVSDEAALFTTLAEVGFNAVRRSGFTWGESALVNGAGVVGQLIARCLAAAGARIVFACDIVPFRARMADSDDGVIGLAGPVGVQQDYVLEHNGGHLVDVVFDATGNPGAIPECFSVLRNEGRLVVASSPTGPTTIDLHDCCNRGSYSIIGAHYFSHPNDDRPGAWTAKRHAELFLHQVASGKVQVTDLLTQVMSAAQAQQAFELIHQPESALGIALDWVAS